MKERMAPDSEVDGNGDGTGFSNGNGTGNGNGSSDMAVLVLQLSCQEVTAEDLREIREIVGEHHGQVPLRLVMTMADGRMIELRAGEQFGVDPSEELLRRLRRWL